MKELHNKKVCILGGKNIEKIVLEYSKNFDIRVKTNCNLQGEIDIEKDQFYLNNHVYNNFVNKNDLKKIFNHYQYTNKNNLEKMFFAIKKVTNNPIQQKESGKNTFSNNFLKTIGCKNLFKKAPRCGHQAILHYLKLGIIPIICGFTINNKEMQLIKLSPCHDFKSEMKVLKELYLMDKIDITPCMIHHFKVPLLDCENLQPKKHFIDYCLQKTGICILKNYFTNEMLLKIISEYDRLFETKKDKINKENFCDEKIFHAEKYSQYIKKHFSDNTLFNSIAKNYNKNLNNKKTLIHKIQYKEGNINNSGTDWYRDNDNYQLKSIMYLTDVGLKNGNFKFITNSNKKNIEFQKPTNKSYNTPFTNETIDKLVKNNCEFDIIDVIANKGTIILVDTTYIHGCKIIEKGMKKSITQYF